MDTCFESSRRVAEMVFDDGSAMMRFRVFFPHAHEESLMKFVEKDEMAFLFRECFFNPYLLVGNPWVDAIVTAGVVVEEEDISDKLAIDNPNGELIGTIWCKMLPMNLFDKRLPGTLEPQDLARK